jgi:peptide/nickel transport system permease protein
MKNEGGNLENKLIITSLDWFGFIITFSVIFLAIFGPYIVPYDPTQVTNTVSKPPPQLRDWPMLFWLSIMHSGISPHWFGTDSSGLDVFSRTIAAIRTDLLIAFSANIISSLVGISLGVVLGYFKNLATEVVLRLADLIQSFPVFITAMVLVALAGRTWGNIILAMTLLYTPIYIRLTRSEVLAVKRRGFVEAARVAGKTELFVAFKHVLPNSLAPSLVQFSITIGFAILLTAGLSFVGAGVRPPTPEWGSMIATGANQLVLGDWWPSIFPGIATSLTVFGFAVCGNFIEKNYDK